jgi:hypothetical protein
VRRPLVLASLAVLLIIGLTWLVLGLEPEAALPPPSVEPSLVAPAPTPAPPPRAAVEPTPPAAPERLADAGSPTPTRDVRFTLRKQGKTVVGERLQFERDRRRASGLLNVMGEVVLPLEDGEWRITSPSAVRPNRVTIGAGIEQIDLEQLDFTVSGVLVDAQQQPVRGWVRFGRSGSGTDLQGRFVIQFDSDEPMTFVGESGSARSLPVRLRPPAKDLVWVVEEPVTLTVTTNVTSTVIVRHRGGFERCDSTPCRVAVLAGEVIVSAVGPRGGVLMTARKSGQVKETTTWDLTLGPTKALKGKLLNARGEPLLGVTVRLEGVALTSEDFSLTDTSTPKRLGSQRAGVTNVRGEFSVPWPDANELFFAVSTDAPIALDRRVYVVPGDGPLTLNALP